MCACPLSIILPCNATDVLQSFIHSFKKQSRDRYELIVVHHYGADGVDVLCQQQRVTFISLPNATGKGAAFNAGAKLSTGDHLIFWGNPIIPAEPSRLLESGTPPISYVHKGKVSALKLTRETLTRFGGFLERSLPFEDIFSEYRQRVATAGYEWTSVELRTIVAGKA